MSNINCRLDPSKGITGSDSVEKFPEQKEYMTVEIKCILGVLRRI